MLVLVLEIAHYDLFIDNSAARAALISFHKPEGLHMIASTCKTSWRVAVVIPTHSELEIELVKRTETIWLLWRIKDEDKVPGSKRRTRGFIPNWSLTKYNYVVFMGLFLPLFQDNFVWRIQYEDMGVKAPEVRVRDMELVWENFRDISDNYRSPAGYGSTLHVLQINMVGLFRRTIKQVLLNTNWAKT